MYRHRYPPAETEIISSPMKGGAKARGNTEDEIVLLGITLSAPSAKSQTTGEYTVQIGQSIGTWAKIYYA